MINQDKKSLRAEYKIIRSSVCSRDAKNHSIAEAVIKSLQYKKADKIFAYWSVGSEV